MADADNTDPSDYICSFCGQTGMDVRKGMISSQTGSGRICDECLKFIGEIQWEDIAEKVTEADGNDSSRPLRLAKPQIVTRYVRADVHPRAWNEDGIDWICDGCGWRLRLSSDDEPPQEHSHEIYLGSWMEFGLGNLPSRKYANMCTVRWRRRI